MKIIKIREDYINFELIKYEFLVNRESRNTLCNFQIKVDNGEKLDVLLISIHLKAEEKNIKRNDTRKKQLNIILKISENFDVTILAGDFNIGETNYYFENQHELFNKFIDIDSFMAENKKPFTWYHKKHNNHRFDRVLIRFKDKAAYLKDSLIARPRQIGNFSTVPYQDIFYEQIKNFNENTYKKLSLSDHFGRCTELMFTAEEKK